MLAATDIHGTAWNDCAPAPGKKKRKHEAKKWLLFVVSNSGVSSFVECDRQHLVHRTSIPVRDLRFRGPLFSPSASILARDKAMLVNLEHIRAIITADEALVLNPSDDPVIPFTLQLKRLLLPTLAPPPHPPSSFPSFSDQNPFCHPSEAAANIPKLSGSVTEIVPQRKHTEGHQKLANDAPPDHGRRTYESSDLLPFEFRVLELVLEAVMGVLDVDSRELEKDAYPALDNLTRKVSTDNLERVRLVKSRLSRVFARVQKVREELQQLVDDESDLADLCLTKKQQLHRAQPDSPGGTLSFPRTASLKSSRRGSIHGTVSHEVDGVDSWKDVEDLEMLLEAYFVQADGIFNRLSALREYIDDTESYVNIRLDYHRNQIQGLQVILTAAMLLATAMLALLGTFSVNIPVIVYHIHGIFLYIVFSPFGGCLVAFVAFVAYVLKHNLVTL